MSCMIKMYAELVRIECNRIIRSQEKKIQTEKLEYNEECDVKGIISRCNRLISMCDNADIDKFIYVDEQSYTFLFEKEE